MKKSVLIICSILLMNISTAQAQWLDSTLDLFGNAYDYVGDISLDLYDDFFSDTETSTHDDSWLYSAPLSTDPNSGLSLDHNSCGEADFSWCPYCSWGWDLISGLFDDIGDTVQCKREDNITEVQSTEPRGIPKKELDEEKYCACLDNNSFPDPTSQDIIKNLVEQKKKEMATEVFEEYQDVAKSLQNLAINPEYAGFIEGDKDICLPGNFAKIEEGLFDSGTADKPAPCNEEARDLMKDALETEMDSCQSGDIQTQNKCATEKPWLRYRQSMEDYNSMVDEMGPEAASKHAGIDNKSLGSWFDFQLKKEFEESTLERFKIHPDEVRSNSEIYKSDFATLGFDFYNLERNDAIQFAKENNRTPDQELAWQLTGFIKNGGTCFDSGDSSSEDVGCDEETLNLLIIQQEEFQRNKLGIKAGASKRETAQAYLAFMQKRSQDLHSRLLAARQIVNPNTDRVGNHARVTATSVAGSESTSTFGSFMPSARRKMDTVIHALEVLGRADVDATKVMPAEDLFKAISRQQEIHRIATHKKLRRRCSQLMQQMVNFCRVVKNQDNFDSGQLLGLTSRKITGYENDEEGRRQPVYEDVANFKDISSIVDKVAPTTGADGKPLTKGEQDKAKEGIKKTLDQLACYESNQMPSMKVDDNYLNDHPPYYQTDGSWISCSKTVNRTIEFRGESRTTRFCCTDEACSNGNGDHEIRAHEDLEYAKLTNFLHSQFGMKAPDVSTDQEEDAAIVETITAPPSNPSGSTVSTSNNNCLYCSVDKSDYDYKHSKKPSSYDNAYYNSVANSSDSTPKSYNDFVKEAKRNGGIPSVDEYGNVANNGSGSSDSTVVRDNGNGIDNNGQTVVNPDGTVTSRNYQDETGSPVVTNRLAQIDQQITANNESLKNVGNPLTNNEKPLPPGTINSDGSVNSENSEIASELAALRTQISALKDDNKKLAEERRAEIANIQRERELKRIAGNPVVQPTPTPSVTRGFSGSSVSSGIISAPNVITGQGNNVSTGTVTNDNSAILPTNSIQSGVISSPIVLNGSSDSGNSISLSAVSADGETMQFSSGDVLNLEGRADIGNLDAAKTLALSSDKNAFVYGGKYYVKRGESFVQVSNIKEQARTVANEATPISDIEGVETLLDSYKEKEDLGEDDVTVNPTPTPLPQINPTASSVQTKETVVEDVDASKRERSFVDKLWGVFDTAGRNLFKLW